MQGICFFFTGAVCAGILASSVFAQSAEKDTMALLVRKLKSTEPTVRQYAAIKLGVLIAEHRKTEKSETLLNDSEEALIFALHDTNSEVRRSAVSAIGDAGILRAVPSLREGLETETNPRVQIALISLLGTFGDLRSEELFHTFMSHDTILLRIEAVKALGNLHTESADRAVIESLNNEIEGMKIIAAEICGRNELYDAEDELLDNCRHSLPEVRLSAVHALARIGGKKTIRQLKKIFRKEENSAVKDAITEAISRIKKNEKAQKKQHKE